MENVYMINFSHRPDRRESTLEQLKKISTVSIFNAIKYNGNKLGYIDSHKKIIRNALNNKLNYVVIFEDNIVLTNEDKMMNEIKELIRYDEWDMIVLEGNVKFAKETDKRISEIFNCDNVSGYIINKRYYDTFLKIYNTENIYINHDEEKFKNHKWYCLNESYFSKRKAYFDINDTFSINKQYEFNKNSLEYFDSIPIIEINKLEELLSINEPVRNLEHVIVNINCSRVPKKFSNIDINLLKNENYDVIQLCGKNFDQNYFHQIIQSNENFLEDVQHILTPRAFLLNNFTLKKIICETLNKTQKYINGDTLNLNNLKHTSLRLPLFLSEQSQKWFEYYNVINFVDKIYCLHLNKDVNRLNNILKVAHMFNKKYNDFFWKSELGVILPNSNELLKNNVIKRDLKHGEIGCNFTQQYILENAIEKGYEKIFVVEDDIDIPNDFFEVFYNMIKKIENFDIIQIGSSINMPSDVHKKKISSVYNYKNYSLCEPIIKNDVNYSTGIGGFFCTILSKNCIQKYIRMNKPITEISDVLLARFIYSNKELSSYIIINTSAKNGLVTVRNYNQSNTFNIEKCIDRNLLETKLFKYLTKINKLQFKVKNKIPIIIGCTKYALEWYKPYLEHISNKFSANINVDMHTKANKYDIYIVTDNDYDIIDKYQSNDFDETLKIKIIGEPGGQVSDKFDITIGGRKKINEINIYCPQLISSLNEHRKLGEKYNVPFNTKKTCCFMYSVDYPHRVEIFNKFSSKMKIDSPGKSCKNMDTKITRNVYNNSETYNDIAVEFYSKYKFVLAIENSIKKAYFTEKLINPILANSIPIYYGTQDAFNIINKKRVIYFNDFENIDTLIDHVINLSNSESEYEKILHEKIFVRNDITLDNYNNFINNQLDSCLGFTKRTFSIVPVENEISNDIPIQLNQMELYYLSDCILKDDIIMGLNIYDIDLNKNEKTKKNIGITNTPIKTQKSKKKVSIDPYISKRNEDIVNVITEEKKYNIDTNAPIKTQSKKRVSIDPKEENMKLPVQSVVNTPKRILGKILKRRP